MKSETPTDTTSPTHAGQKDDRGPELIPFPRLRRIPERLPASRSRILVVEDEALVALAISSSLKKMGYDVVATVPTGEEAVRLAQEVYLDLVIMDIQLKGDLDGIAAAELIRASVAVPVVYMTAYSDDVTLRRAKLAEPFGFLVKPYQDQELHAAVEVAIHNGELERDRLRVDHMSLARVSSNDEPVEWTPPIKSDRE